MSATIDPRTVVAGSPESKPLWDALAEGRLELQRCENCGCLRFPPIASCPYCSTPDGTWEPVEARGRLYSWVVTHVPFDPSLADEVPYTVATVVLDAGPKMFARLTDVEPDQIRAEMELEGYPHVEDGLPYLRFRPAANDG
jgi:uncharacterized OB-fold protein